MSITRTEARTEIARRALPKGDPARKVYPRPEIMSATGADLKALVGTPAKASAPKAPTAKVGKAKAAKVVNPHTHQRAAANAVKRAYWVHTGENMTYVEACALFGTAPAKAEQDDRPVSKTHASKATLALKDPAAFVAEVLV